jgi:hypothetical protein
VPLAVKETTV